jgi:EAL domain-containing protein (putative c-di-GMP-specific phosphodiesterase class I)
LQLAPERFERVAVNVSARQLAHPGLVNDVAAVLAQYCLAPQALCLEITDSALVDSAAATRRSVEGLKELGVTLALDDFGTG